MSKPFDHKDVFDSQERADARFGAEEGVEAYERLAANGLSSLVKPDRTVGENAERVTRIAMIVSGRFDVNVARASVALTDELEMRTFGDIDGIS